MDSFSFAKFILLAISLHLVDGEETPKTEKQNSKSAEIKQFGTDGQGWWALNICFINNTHNNYWGVEYLPLLHCFVLSWRLL